MRGQMSDIFKLPPERPIHRVSECHDKKSVTSFDGYRKLNYLPSYRATIRKFEFALQPPALVSDTAQMDSLLRCELCEILQYLFDTRASYQPRKRIRAG